MCGRYQLNYDPRTFKLFPAKSRAYSGPFLGSSLWNIHPGMRVPVIYHQDDGYWVEPFLWQWTIDTPKGTRRFKNIRSETLLNRPDMGQQRCIIPATAFYEWETLPDGSKQPWMIQWRETKQPFFMAGIWREWDSPQGPVNTMAILTSEPNELMAQIHHRQPVVLDEEKAARWMAAFDPELFTPIFRGRLMATPISTAINNTKNPRESAVQPIRLNRPPVW